MSDIIKLTEIKTPDILISQLQSIFIGFKKEHFESIMGSSRIKEVLLEKNEGREEIVAKIKPLSDKQYSQLELRGIFYSGIKRRSPQGYVSMIFNGPKNKKNVRSSYFFWDHYDDQEGQNFSSFYIGSLKGEVVANKRMGSLDNRHYILLERKPDGIQALDWNRKPYPMEIEENNGTIGIRAYKDGKTFKAGFSLIVPACVKINREAFEKAF